MAISSFAPLPPYQPSPTELMTLSRLARTSSLLGTICSVAGAVFVALVLAHGVQPGTLGVVVLERWINGIANDMPQAYGTAVNQVVPDGMQGPAMQAFGMAAVFAAMAKAWLDAKVRNIREPTWRKTICS